MIKNINCLDGLKELADNSVSCVVTSPPYNKKGISGGRKIGNQIWKNFNIDYEDFGDDMTEEDYQAWMVEVLNELYRVIKSDGSVFFNHKPRRAKNKCFLPTDFIQKSKLDIYQVIIWNRKNSPNIRNDILVPCTEYIYWLTKGKPAVYRSQVDEKYKGEVWEMSPERQRNHPAPFPKQLPTNCINLTTLAGDLVIDPFAGSGTTIHAALELGRNALGFEITSKYYDNPTSLTLF